MPLVFEVATDPAPAASGRNDIACFVGHVARRAGTPLPAGTADALRRAGWIGGPWAADAARLAALADVPVAVDSWTEFQRLYDWASRPVTEGGQGRAASLLGAAVRSFFAQGGRRAVIVRVGDPWPVIEADVPASVRAQRLDALAPAAQVDAMDPRAWRGLAHLHGVAEAAMVCLPDLPEIYRVAVPPPATRTPLVAVPEVFVECSVEVPAVSDTSLRRTAAPGLDAAGWAAWAGAVGRVRAFLLRFRRDCLFIGALPLPASHDDSPAAGRAFADPLAMLLGAGVLLAPGTDAAQASSALVQLAWPWLRLRNGADLAEALTPPDGVLAGVLAANALARGTFRSAAGRPIAEVVDALPQPAWGLAPDSPWQRLAERICVIAPEPGGWALQSDVTASPDRAWRGGQASRLVASVLRAAREIGQPHVFGPNGPALWAEVQRGMEQLLLAYWRAGGLGGAGADEAFDVRCDRATMTQADLDAGRIVCRVTLLPAAAVDRITVTFALAAGDDAALPLAEAA